MPPPKEEEEEEDLGKIFVQAFHAVVANQRANYTTSQRENSYWEDLIYNGCLMYHPTKGANLPFPVSTATANPKQEHDTTTSPQETKEENPAIPDAKCSETDTKQTSVAMDTKQDDDSARHAQMLDAVLDARHKHVLSVLDQLSLQSCQQALQRLFPLDNYVLLKLLPAKHKAASAERTRKRPRRKA